jgi:hypothetical protein
MDFSSRNPQSAAHQGNTVPSGASAATANNKNKGGRTRPSWLSIAAVVLLLGVTAILVLFAFLFVFAGNNNNTNEDKFVNSKSYQAVFLTNGQVYFGNIKNLNTKYVDLDNIYYLQTSNSNGSANTSSTSNSATNVSLVKLGCELHGPYDEMLINRDQVTFWENLKGSGQVAKAIAQYKQQNPNGQNCSTSNSTNSTNQAPTTGTGTNATKP